MMLNQCDSLPGQNYWFGNDGRAVDIVCLIISKAFDIVLREADEVQAG